ncbi:unnamed protein product [Phytophthora lilii]|uniref:Unnamed protein product n=1 Tax=Phytophthora lilii TaxID=2077276 RepID=A0A9W6TFI2_9STRA|nr:unnamed protein product [Phytophthora lilii]
MLFGDGTDAQRDERDEQPTIGGSDDADSIAARHDAAAHDRSRIDRTFARPPDELQLEEESRYNNCNPLHSKI